MVYNEQFDCKANIFFREIINLANNNANFLMYISNMVIHMNGTINVLENNVTLGIVDFDYCDLTFAKVVRFLSNTCSDIIYLKSFELPYVIIMEYANIIFAINTCYHLMIVFEKTINNYNSAFPHCLFQYIANVSNISDHE